MKWFKHESSAGDSPRLRRLRAKYGAEGYGLYWFIVEQVGIGWETHGADLNPSLEMEDIEAELRIGSGQAPDMIRWMIEKGLFEASTIGLLKCESLRNHVGEAQRKAERRERPKLNSGQAPDSVRIVSGPTPEKEEIRGEEIRGEKKKNTLSQAAPAGLTDSLPFDLTSPPAKRKGTIPARFEQFWAAVGKKQEKKAALAEFARINPDDELLVKMIAAMGVYQRNRPLEFQKAVHRWLKGECWNDELQTGPAPGAPRKPEQKTDMQRALERMAREMVDE